MANERALLRYRNPDSTQDINDRLKGLFVKGVFEGGLLTPVTGVLRVILGPNDTNIQPAPGFSTVGSDGMFVKQSNEQTFDLASDALVDVKTYIVIQQQYQVNTEPTLTVEALTEDIFSITGPVGEQGAANPNMIVFGTVTVPAGANAISSSDIEYFERDEIDILGRSSFRGLVADSSALPIAGLNANRTGDYYIVTDGSGGTSVPSFWSWNGSAWVNSTDTSDLQAQLDAHRGNTNESGAELHLSTAQSAALSGAGIEDPGAPLVPPISDGLQSYDTNKYVLVDYPLIPTEDEKGAMVGNGTPLEDELPNPTNLYVTSTKVIAAPDEISPINSFIDDIGSGDEHWVELGTSQNSDGYYVGTEANVVPNTNTATQWFSLYSLLGLEPPAPTEYVNDEFASVEILDVRVGDVGNTPTTTSLNPAGDTHIDDLGFFICDNNPGGTLYLKLSQPISVGGARASFGRRTHWGDFHPSLMIKRGPQDAQINTVMLRLLTGTPNIQFSTTAIWDNVVPGQVAAWNPASSQFVVADPNNMKMPIGVRGTANNLIQEGMLVLDAANFPTGSQVYADKANPGSLTTTPNEWFIGTAITDTTLLVNMNGIPLQASGEVTPGVTFPSSLFLSVQEGQAVAFEQASGNFVRSETQNPLKLPTGIRGTGNNVIISGLYAPSSGAPYVLGTKYYADPNTPGSLTTSSNDWYVGIATANNQLLVNVTSVAIPHKWTQEHDTNSGNHKFSSGGTVDRPADPVTGTLFLRTDLLPPRVEYWDGDSWENASSDFALPVDADQVTVSPPVEGQSDTQLALEALSTVSNANVPTGLLQGSFEYVNTTTVRLARGLGGTIRAEIDGVILTRSGSDIDFDITGATRDTWPAPVASNTPHYAYISNNGGTMDPHISETEPDDVGDTKPGYHPTESGWRCVGCLITEPSSANVYPFDNFGSETRLRGGGIKHELTKGSDGAATWGPLIPIGCPETIPFVLGLHFSFGHREWGFIAASDATGLGFPLTAENDNPDNNPIEAISWTGNSDEASDDIQHFNDVTLRIADRSAPAIYAAYREIGDGSNALIYHNFYLKGWRDPWSPRSL